MSSIARALSACSWAGRAATCRCRALRRAARKVIQGPAIKKGGAQGDCRTGGTRRRWLLSCPR
eukprot:636427-Alexandrium_andersonii.AAC.1